MRLALGAIIFLFAFTLPLEQVFALVNINTAGVDELDGLPGIGPAKAEAIIDYRESVGLFQNKEDIKNVSGIGDATYEDIKDLITVGTATAPESETINDTEEENVDEDTEASESDSSGGSAKRSSPEANISVDQRIAVVGNPVRFVANGDEYKSTNGVWYRWNFGDGTTGNGKVIEHIFEETGEYTVTVVAHSRKKQFIDSVIISVTEGAVTISNVTPGVSGFIELTNSGSVAVDLSFWKIVSGGQDFVLPEHTQISPKASIRISAETLGANLNSTATLYVPNGAVASVYRPQEKIPAKNKNSLVAGAALAVQPTVENQATVVADDPEPQVISQTKEKEDSLGVWIIALSALIIMAIGGLIFFEKRSVLDSHELRAEEFAIEE